MIRFNQPQLCGRESEYVAQAIRAGHLSDGGPFGERCREILRRVLGSSHVWLTASCTAALEMSALLFDLRPGDEVVMPSFTYVSTANAFLRAGLKPVFADIRADTLNLDENAVEAVLTSRTRAIVPVHYGSVACDMDALGQLAAAHGLHVVEDAAHGLGARYRGRALGALGDVGCLSFHETKNVHCGQGGAICIRNPEYLERAEMLLERGTDRARFLRGEISHYSWIGVGSSFGLSELSSAFLCGQLEALEAITATRLRLRGWYDERLAALERRGILRQPAVPPDCETNGHTTAVLLEDGRRRDALMRCLLERDIQAVIHYVPLHLAPYGQKLGPHAPMPVTENVSGCLLRLPMHGGLSRDDVGRVVDAIEAFY